METFNISNVIDNTLKCYSAGTYSGKLLELDGITQQFSFCQQLHCETLLHHECAWEHSLYYQIKI